ncbi:LuxR C-terminal-related transcriptional regulator [Streptomyces sp. BB1-1-1]|uniref:response regulator transcription factor n=1 Tax=Streptomyces sp. BB1-1-1 TaxID=3074430 RepID=UPI0028779503|nr:LuxR C-terminal-related transcriptional regulator [Streptomyces sp. BB1-1-1]WND34020.1 LuxR C-terminal-related transcriptional regulator [Streptomyces sp. BB1-1-1]
MADDSLAFPWARDYDADQLAAFIEDLWGAASGDNTRATLDAIERVIAERAPGDNHSPRCPLTPRQIDVLTELASGETCASAGENLGVSVHTIKTITADVVARLHARSTTHACTIAVHYGWLTGHRVPPPAPLPRRRGPVANAGRHAERAAQLRKTPGVEAVVGDYGSRNTAYRAARQIPRGGFSAYEPAGDFQARAYLTKGSRWVVAARYVGTPTTAERAAS